MNSFEYIYEDGERMTPKVTAEGSVCCCLIVKCEDITASSSHSQESKANLVESHISKFS